MLIAPRLTALSFVINFEQEPPDLPSCLERASSISIGILGNPLTEIRFQRGQGEKEQCQRVRLSDLATVVGNSPGSWITSLYKPKGSGRYEKFQLDEYAWFLYYSARTAMFGEDISAFLAMTFNLDLLDNDDRRSLTVLSKNLFDLAGLGANAASGFGDVADFYETSLGYYYTGTGLSWVHPQRNLNRFLWAKTGLDRIRKLRGIYWANYFGSEIVSELGSPSELASAYSRFDTGGEQKLSHIYDDGSMLFVLTSDVAYFCYPYQSLPQSMYRRYEWLHKRLKIANLLI